MSDLQKINIITKAELDSLDLAQYPNQIFGTTDEGSTGSGGGTTVKVNGVAQTEWNADLKLDHTASNDTETTTLTVNPSAVGINSKGSSGVTSGGIGSGVAEIQMQDSETDPTQASLLLWGPSYLGLNIQSLDGSSSAVIGAALGEGISLVTTGELKANYNGNEIATKADIASAITTTLNTAV